jgi:hypothetical protein
LSSDANKFKNASYWLAGWLAGWLTHFTSVAEYSEWRMNENLDFYK